jgi:hypothetical protein
MHVSLLVQPVLAGGGALDGATAAGAPPPPRSAFRLAFVLDRGFGLEPPLSPTPRGGNVAEAPAPASPEAAAAVPTPQSHSAKFDKTLAAVGEFLAQTPLTVDGAPPAGGGASLGAGGASLAAALALLGDDEEDVVSPDMLTRMTSPSRRGSTFPGSAAGLGVSGRLLGAEAGAAASGGGGGGGGAGLAVSVGRAGAMSATLGAATADGVADTPGSGAISGPPTSPSAEVDKNALFLDGMRFSPEAKRLKGTIERQLDGYLAKRQAALETHSGGSTTGGGLGGLLGFKKTGSDSHSEVRETTARERKRSGLVCFGVLTPPTPSPSSSSGHAVVIDA